MICNYQNITDYCLNKFTYQYADVSTANSGDLTTSVIRTDKDTGEVITIGPNSDLYILPCDINDVVEVISAWECYQIFVNNNNFVSKTNTSVIEYNQKEKISNNYDLNAKDNIVINIDNFNSILLDSSTENQVHLGNIFCLSNILYNEDSNSIMPQIYDTNNISYTFNYNSLKQLLTTYFYKTAQVKNIKDDSLFNISNLNNTDDINNTLFYQNKVTNNLTKSNNPINFSVYKNPVANCLPLGVCDPPCDIDNCQICASGLCVNLCNPGEYCYSGLCESDTCCEYTGTNGVYGFVWLLDVNCAECNFFTCPDPASIMPEPTGIGQKTYRPCPFR